MDRVYSHREQAAKWLLERGGVPNRTLVHIIRDIEPLRKKAAKQLLGQAPSHDELLWVIDRVEPLRPRAWHQMVHILPRRQDLDYISKNVKSLQTEAAEYLAQGRLLAAK